VDGSVEQGFCDAQSEFSVRLLRVSLEVCFQIAWVEGLEIESTRFRQLSGFGKVLEITGGVGSIQTAAIGRL
jgi:hypothetical protein